MWILKIHSMLCPWFAGPCSLEKCFETFSELGFISDLAFTNNGYLPAAFRWRGSRCHIPFPCYGQFSLANDRDCLLGIRLPCLQ
jgi:hypothetical protein